MSIKISNGMNKLQEMQLKAENTKKFSTFNLKNVLQFSYN